MSPVRWLGPFCWRCGRGAAMPNTGVCRRCELLNRAFPQYLEDPPEFAVAPITDRDIYAWLRREAA